MQIRKKIEMLLALIIMLITSGILISQPAYKPEELGIKIKQGRIDYEYMEKHKNDTVITGNFNYEDEYPDVAVLYRTRGELVIYINQRNGLLSEYKRIKEPYCERIETVEQRNAEYFARPKNEILIYNRNKSNRIMNVIEINKRESDVNSNNRVPAWDVFSDGKVFIYDFEFNQVWQSYRGGLPQANISLGDVDNDGKNEAIFTFYPVNDTVPQNKPTHITVFESYGDNQYRIDWDTTLQQGGFLSMNGMYDFDKNGKKEFFINAHDNWGYFTRGVMECAGEGKYRFYNSNLPSSIGSWYDLQYLDSAGFRTIHPVDTMRNKRGFMGLWGLSGGTHTIMGFTYFARGEGTSGAGSFAFVEWENTVIETHFQVYDIEYGDIDKDGKNEILIGDVLFETNVIDYLDSTGGGPYWQHGWEVKTIIPNAPISGGYSVLKDYDNDGHKEITVCGIGNLSGSIGTVRHIGSPGENQFVTVYWDSTGIDAGPNMYIDTGKINNKYVILYPYYFRRNFTDYYYFMTYTRTGVFDMYRSSYKVMDSSSSVRSFLFDMDRDNRNSIISSYSYQKYFSGNAFLTDFESNTTIGITPIGTEIPKVYQLFQNYPNPFNSMTNIQFQVASSKFVKLAVYDILGREVKTLVNEYKQAGTYQVSFNAEGLSSGIYFCRMTAGNFSDVKRMVLVR